MPAKTVIVRIDANITWEVMHDPQSRQWIGVCKALNLNAIGETWGEFVECANEAMQLLFIDLFVDGELSKFLRLNNWRPSTRLPARSARPPRFDIPFDWERKGRYEELLAATA